MDGIRIDLSKAAKADFLPNTEGRAVPSAKPFEDVLREAVAGVSDLQTDADTMVQRLSLGDVDDVSEVVVSVQKAELAFRLMVQIRDKLVDAYEQLGRIAV